MKEWRNFEWNYMDMEDIEVFFISMRKLAWPFSNENLKSNKGCEQFSPYLKQIKNKNKINH